MPARWEILLAVTALAGAVLAEEPAAPPRVEWRVETEPALRFGPLDGYLQIPKGGVPSAASFSRPTLHELGQDEQVLYDRGERRRLG